MNFDSFVNLISKIENLPLPGEASQFKMAPPYRDELIKNNAKILQFSKKAGVLALFYPNAERVTCLSLILRKTYKGVHSAQVGFPGGRYEPIDTHIKQTALRETFEEVGVPQNDITIVRALNQMYIPPSNFSVFPFLALTHKTPQFVLQESEVEALIEVPLQDFLSDKCVVQARVETANHKQVETPAYKLCNYVVWGATAMILSELKDLLKKGM